MNPKVALRRVAMRLYWQAGLSKAEICRQLKKHRRWVVRWLKRYDHKQGEKIQCKKQVPFLQIRNKKPPVGGFLLVPRGRFELPTKGL